jgi:hypothetical protein
MFGVVVLCLASEEIRFIVSLPLSALGLDRVIFLLRKENMCQQ